MDDKTSPAATPSAPSPSGATLDLAIVGGGITGLAVARLAARNGLRVALIERGDLASGTSSVSSHMLHGGLRYLEQARFALVHEALEERSAVSRMAPTLARPRRFLVPLYKGDRVPPWKMRLGLQLYDWLAGKHGLAPHSMTRAREALSLEPDLAPEGLMGAALYSDSVMDDARLAIAVACDAAAHGASLSTYTELTGARPAGDGTLELQARDVLDGTTRNFTARVVVNATGPWTDAMRRLFARALTPGAPEPRPLLRPSRGVHLVYPPITRGHGLLLTARSDGRVLFVVPLENAALVGTTEVEVPSPPPEYAARPSVDEVRYLRLELARALPGLADALPMAAIAGIRPLIDSSEEIGQASREHRVIEENGVITVAGGKYTTFRVMARDTLELVAKRLKLSAPIRDSEDPLPMPPSMTPGPDALAAHAIEHEFARRLEDVMRRRSTGWLTPDRGRGAARPVAAAMARRLGWSEERMAEELKAYDAARWEEESLLQRAKEVV